MKASNGGNRLGSSWIATAILSTITLLISAPSQAASSTELERLINAGQSAEAYRLGSSTPKPQGDRYFDYFHGIAAVDAGHAEEGARLLQGYVTTNPADLRARLELARARFILGEVEAARSEFQSVRKEKIPAAVAANIETYLQVIEDRLSGKQTTPPRPAWGGYLEAGVGHDSNINGGVAGANVNLPIIGATTIDSSGVQKSAMYARMAGGVQVQRHLAGNWEMFGSGTVDARGHNRSSAFDTLYATGQGGVSYQLNSDNALRASLQYNHLNLGGHIYQTTPSGVGEWNWAVSKRLTLSLGVQTGRLQYEGSNEVRNARFNLLTGGLRLSLGGNWRPTLMLNLNAGRERNTKDRNDLSRDSGGGRIGLEFNPSERWLIAIGYGDQPSRYLANDPFFGLARQDHARSFDLSVIYAMAPEWSVRGEASHIETHSNVAIYQSNRTAGAISLRRSF